MIKFVKNERVKFVSEGSALIQPLLADGWEAQGGGEDSLTEDHPAAAIESLSPQRGRKKKHDGDSP